MKENKFKWGHLIVYLILIMGIVVTILPFTWMVLTSLKGQTEAIRVPPVIFPEVLRFENYAKVFEKIPFARMYMNTIINAVVVVIMQLLLCSMAAYAFGRIKFPGRNVIFGILLAVLMVPSSFFILPQYLIIQKMRFLSRLAFSIDVDLSFIEVKNTHNTFDGSGLSCTIVADESIYLSLLDVEGKIIYGLLLAVFLCQVLYSKHNFFLWSKDQVQGTIVFITISF